jgi:Txe/YoeB family toxin of Txe-Axe toxin-antitoxin module
MIIPSGESEVKTKTGVVIGRFLTQRLVRAKKFEKLIQHEVYRASYTTLKNNETSNAILIDIYTRRSDAFHRFVVVGRADCLPTPLNLPRWFNDRGNENCTRAAKRENRRWHTF